MKERQKKILRFMLFNDSMLHIEDIADTFSIGKRTVSRDLDMIESWLSYRGAGLERKPNQGIRVLLFGKSANEILDNINSPENYLESLDADHRQKLILLYLLFSSCEVKISSIANVFYVSDTSVWSDLKQIERGLEGSELIIERMKGVGIRLSGPESVIRLRFLSVMTEAFASNTIIPYIYIMKEDKGSTLEINQLKLIMKRLDFPENNTEILDTIAELSNRLGYHFTMASESLLYFYLQLSIHRIESGKLIQDGGFLDCLPFFAGLGKFVLDILTIKVISGNLSDSEYCFLGLLLQVLEPGDLNAIGSEEIFGGMITEDIVSFADELISEFGRIDGRQYYLNDKLEPIMQKTLMSLVTRLRNGIPYWHGEWGEAPADSWNRNQKMEVLADLLKRRFGLEPEMKDLDHVLMSFHSMIFNREDLPGKKVRTLVCCFEGIALANYLRSILTREIETVNVVESTAVFKIKQEYLDANNIELVISTFPISGLDIPVVLISLPLNREEFIKKIDETVTAVRRRKPAADAVSIEIGADGDSAVEKPFFFGEALEFVNKFQMIRLSKNKRIEEIIQQLAKELTSSITCLKMLSKDLQQREDLGALFLDEWGIRVLHCKSSVVSNPTAGVLEFDGEEAVRMLFMIAPDPCPDYVRKMLATVIISLSENSSFRAAFLSSGIDQIKKNLIEIYSELT